MSYSKKVLLAGVTLSVILLSAPVMAEEQNTDSTAETPEKVRTPWIDYKTETEVRAEALKKKKVEAEAARMEVQKKREETKNTIKETQALIKEVHQTLNDAVKALREALKIKMETRANMKENNTSATETSTETN